MRRTRGLDSTRGGRAAASMGIRGPARISIANTRAMISRRSGPRTTSGVAGRTYGAHNSKRNSLQTRVVQVNHQTRARPGNLPRTMPNQRTTIALVPTPSTNTTRREAKRVKGSNIQGPNTSQNENTITQTMDRPHPRETVLSKGKAPSKPKNISGSRPISRAHLNPQVTRRVNITIQRANSHNSKTIGDSSRKSQKKIIRNMTRSPTVFSTCSTEGTTRRICGTGLLGNRSGRTSIHFRFRTLSKSAKSGLAYTLRMITSLKGQRRSSINRPTRA
jgi:hypothetical protein